VLEFKGYPTMQASFCGHLVYGHRLSMMQDLMFVLSSFSFFLDGWPCLCSCVCAKLSVLTGST